MKTILRNFISVLRRFKMATLLNILGLSVAFSAFMIIMMQVDYDQNFDTFHNEADNIYRVELQWGKETPQAIVSRPLMDVFFNFSPHIVAGAISYPIYSETVFIVDKDGKQDSYMEPNMTIYPSFTDVFTFDMLEGTKDALKDPEKILISESQAKKIFGTESAVGRRMKAKDTRGRLAGLFTIPEMDYTVGGVYKDFPVNGILQNAVYVKLDDKEGLNDWGSSNYYAYIRLDSPEAAKDLTNDFLDYYKKHEIGKNMPWSTDDLNLRLTPLTELHYVTDVLYDMVPKTSRQTILVLIAIAFVIMLIAGINFTNFSTALTPMRMKSINTQKVLGSSNATLQFSLLMEAVCISVVAFLLALWIVRMTASSPIAGLINADISFSAHPVLISLTALLSVLVGVLAGIYPSYYMTSFSPALVLKGNFGLSPKGRVLRNVLISVQFISSFVLIMGAMFMYLQNNFMRTSSLGYDKDQIIVTDLTATVLNSKDAFTNRMKSFSGIEDVTCAEFLLASQDQYMTWGRELNGKNIQYQVMPVDPSFLKVLNIAVSDGRDFREEDTLTEHGAYIFNERARKTYDIQLGDKIGDMEVIGFVPDIKFASFRTEVVPMAFLVRGKSYSGGAAFAYIKVKAGSDMGAAMAHVKNVMSEIHPDYPFDITFFDKVLNNLYEKETSLGALITLFSLIAVFISMVGVFGLVVFDSQYRRKEIGVRKVMGASVSQILIMFNKTYVRILLICFVLAAPLTWYAIHAWLENFAYRTPIYWWVFILAFLLVSAVTIVTVTFQNWRAASENPVISIKTE
ncbi:ABC transporter permease [Parabacteroides goldsteinii]|uniref:ABC transporter permease n=1 Tax=Parabacteroides goldsteinii TaxID=328812 RepID=UPI0032B20837